MNRRRFAQALAAGMAGLRFGGKVKEPAKPVQQFEDVALLVNGEEVEDHLAPGTFARTLYATDAGDMTVTLSCKDRWPTAAEMKAALKAARAADREVSDA